MNEERLKRCGYALVTAAYNEASYIERVIESILAQSLRPEKWIIVSDGSTDATDEIVMSYARKHSLIYFLRIDDDHPRNFAAQASAINRGFELLQTAGYEYIGNLDADVSVEPEYFVRLIEKFESNPDLGLAGGFIYEEDRVEFKSRRNNSVNSVAHAVQLFRRECLTAVGGYAPLPYGGPDWLAEIVARMNGWRVQAYPELRVYHHRPTGTAGSLLVYCYRQGLMDFTVGSDPVFEVAKCLKRLWRKPLVAGAAARLLGFTWAHVKGVRRPVSDEVVAFLRNEQKCRLRGALRNSVQNLIPR